DLGDGVRLRPLPQPLVPDEGVVRDLARQEHGDQVLEVHRSLPLVVPHVEPQRRGHAASRARPEGFVAAESTTERRRIRRRQGRVRARASLSRPTSTSMYSTGMKKRFKAVETIFFFNDAAPTE